MKNIKWLIALIFLLTVSHGHGSTNEPTEYSERYIQALENTNGPLMRKTSEYRKAMKSHLQSYPRCNFTNVRKTFYGRNNDVHHYVPVSVDISKACDTNNMVTLVRDMHFILGHLGNWSDQNVRLKETIIAVKKAIVDTAESRKGNNALLKRFAEDIKNADE